jgi:transcriptional regulator with XRE-family HTH domain
VRLRTARLRRGMTQIALAEMACVSASFVSMVETGQRELTRVCDIAALADVLRVSPLYLADGWDDHLSPGQRPTRTVPFPARCDPITLAQHQQLAAQFVGLARQDGRAAGTGCADWPASPASIPGCCSTSSPRSCPPQITQEMSHHDPHTQSHPLG